MASQLPLPSSIIQVHPARGALLGFPPQRTKFYIGKSHRTRALWVSLLPFLDAWLVLRLRDDRYLATLRHRPRPFPADLWFRSFVRLTRKGQHENSGTGNHVKKSMLGTACLEKEYTGTLTAIGRAASGKSISKQAR